MSLDEESTEARVREFHMLRTANRAASDSTHPTSLPRKARAALVAPEEVTRVSETHTSDEAYAAAAVAFEPKKLVDLTIAIAAMNASTGSVHRSAFPWPPKPEPT